MKSKLYKKIMALAMAGAMTLSLAACGGNDASQDSGQQSSGQQSAGGS